MNVLEAIDGRPEYNGSQFFLDTEKDP